MSIFLSLLFSLCWQGAGPTLLLEVDSFAPPYLGVQEDVKEVKGGVSWPLCILSIKC